MMQRPAIEYDGASHRESLTADNRRQNRMMNAGFTLLRSAQLTFFPLRIPSFGR